MSHPDRVPPIVDTHAHLDEPAFELDRDDVLNKSRRAGVRRFINIGYKPERWETSRAIRDAHPDVDITVGLHPHESATLTSESERHLVTAVQDLAPIAIGESGFDLVRSAPTLLDQERAFQLQIELAISYELPIIIHMRNAAAALMTELDRWPELETIVLHSFDGTPQLTDWAIERGCFVGVGGLAARPAASALRDLLARFPRTQLLLETDSPYLSPPGVDSRNTPANLSRISQMVAPIWRLTGAELCWITSRNANTLFSLGIDECLAT